MRTGTNRFLSLLLTLCLLTGLLPVYSHAEGVATPTDMNSPMLLSEPVTATVTITNTKGTLSYSVDGLPEGVTVDSQQWYRDDPISDATGDTYTMTRSDMGGPGITTIWVSLTLSDDSEVEGSYVFQNNEWYLSGDDTHFCGTYNDSTTNFPYTVSEPGVITEGTIYIDQNANVTGVNFIIGNVDCIEVNGTLNSCALNTYGQIIVYKGGKVNGGSISAAGLNNSGSITGTHITLENGCTLQNTGSITGTRFTLGDNCTIVNSGTITLDLSVNGTRKQVQYDEEKKLIDLLDSLAPRDEGKGEVWMQNGTVIDDSATLDLSMQGASFVSVPIPMLTIQHGGAALSKTERNELTIGSSLSVSALNCEPISYEWYGLVSGNTYTHIGSGATFTIPTFISSSNDGSNIPAAQYYGSLYCEATLEGGSTVTSPSYLIYLFPKQQPKDLVSNNTEGKYTVGTVLSFDKNADFFSEKYGLTLDGYHWGDKKPDKLNSNASATYTLTAADLQGDEHTITGWMYLLNQTTGQQHAYPATYTIPANNEWTLADGTLTFIGNYNAATTQFPIDGLTYNSVDTKAGSVIANAAFADCTVNNSGTIYGTTFKNCTVNNSGTIHVPVTIDGSSYTSTPDSDCQYLYGANTLATLNAWYAAQHPSESTEGLIWLDASTKQEVASDATLGLSNSFILFGTMNVTIDAPTGYYAESTLYANVTLNANVDVSLDYTWKLEDTERFKNRYYQLMPEDVGHILELTVTATTNDGYSVTRTAQTDTVQRPIYTVQIQYKNEKLHIRQEMTDLTNLVIRIPSYSEVEVSGNYFVPLTDQTNPVDVDLAMSGTSKTTGESLTQTTQLTLNRRQTDEIAAGDFTLNIPRSGNPRKVTITCSNPSKYWGIRVADTVYPMNESGVFTVSVPAGTDVKVETRLPGSDADRLLPSLWSEVGTIPASQWLSFSVTENNLLSNDSTLYWGETLTVKTNADTLTWCINGKEVADPSTVTDGKHTYSIPTDVNSLTITATKNSETATYTASPMCPFTMDTDYQAETITFTLRDDCNGLDFQVSVPQYNRNYNFLLGWVTPDGEKETMALASPIYNYDFLSLAPANLQINVSSYGHYLFTMLYPLERFNASMENADVSITANYPTSNDKWRTGISFSTKDPYTIIPSVQLRNTADNKVLTYDYGDGEAYFTTKANTTYSVWVKQVSVNGDNRFTSFESDWLDTGLKVTTGITLDRPSPIAGQTVTATSGMVCPKATETWKWERIENNSLVSVGTNSNAYTISASDAQWTRYYNVSFRVTHTLTVNGATYSASATTGVLPVPQLVLKDQNENTLTVPTTGGVLVDLGTTVTAYMTNFEGDLTWRWTSDDGRTYKESSSIIISTSRPSAMLQDPLNPNMDLVTVTCNIPAPQVTIDYVNEAFILENVPAAFAAMFSEGKVYIVLIDNFGRHVGIISETTGSHAISDVIWEERLGTQLPDDSEHTLTFRWFIDTDEASGYFGNATTLTVPARPEDIEPEKFHMEINDHPLSITPYSITYTGNQDWEIGVEADGKIVTGEALQNLQADTPYDLYCRVAASNDPTNPHFATDWVFGTEIRTASRMQLTPEFETITYAPGMSLGKDDLLTKLYFSAVGNNVIQFFSDYLSLSLKEGSFPITDVGTYTVLLATKPAFNKAYELTSTEYELTIGALNLSGYKISYSPEMTYTGSPLPLPSFSFVFYDAASSRSIRVDLDSSSDYEIMGIFDRNSGDGYSSMQNAGQYTIVLKCKGNYTGYPSVYVTVNPRDIKDCVVAPLKYDGSAQKLTVSVDGRTLTQDTDYTVLITRDNQTVTEIKEAGTYTVTLTGKGNYTGSDETTVTVSPAPLTVAQTGDIAFTYSGATAFDLQDASALTLCGIVDGDTVSLSDVSLTLKSKDAQTAPQQAAISATLTGDDAGNYTLQTNQTCQVLVNQKKIAVVPESPKTFAYTGTTDVPMSGTGWTLEGTIAGDDVALDLTNLSATVADATVGEDKPVTITGWALKGADAANYAITTVTARTVTIIPAPAIEWPTPGTITYGDALSKSTLAADAHGTFAWQSGDTILSAGTHTQTIVYSPADTANYDYTGVTLTATATVTVAKAPAPAIVWPTASAITYGEALGASTLTSDDKNGTFAWKAPSQILAAGEHFATVVCTPADKTNYDYRGVTLEKKIAMQVNKAATVIDVSGVKTDYTYTGKLQTVDSGAKLNHREAKLAYANNTFTTVREGNGLTVTITAPETANYLAAEATVTLTVTPSKAPAIQWPTAGKLTYGQQLSESELKGGSTNLGTFAWQEDATMKAIGPQTFTLTFTPADTENYLWDDSALVQGVKLRVDKRPVTIRADSKTKSYGAPDPALTATVEGLLDGDTIDYTLTRDPGETAGTYAIRVQASDTDTYTVTTVRGTLTISAKDMEALTPDTLPTQLYTGSALKPTPIVRDAAGNVLKEGRDYTLTYVDNQQPGLGTVIITGKGNYTGTLELTFPVVDPAESEALKALLGAETGEGSMPPTLVYTEDGTPKDYTLLDVTGRLPGQNEAVRVLLTEDTSGETEAHVLAIPADQLATLTRARGVRQLAFTHLNAAVLVPTEALLSGEAAKLAATSLGLTTEPETELTLEQLEALRYEIRIAPVEESDAVAVSVWLCWPEGEVELTPYLPGLLVGLTLTDDMTPENWTLAMRGADGTESAAETQLLVVPDDLLDVIDAIDWYSLTIHADGVEEVLSSPGLPPESSHRTLLGTVPSGTDCQLRLQPTDAE